jgi:hypothetical protein
VDPYVLWNVDQPGHKFEAAEEASCDNQTCGLWVVSWQTPKDPLTLCFGYRTDCYTIGTQGVPISQNSSLLASSVWISWCIPSSFSLLSHDLKFFCALCHRMSTFYPILDEIYPPSFVFIHNELSLIIIIHFSSIMGIQ